MDEDNSIDNQIDNIVRDNKICRFASELQHTTDETRKKTISTILKSLDKSAIQNDLETDAQAKLKKIYENIDNEALKKKWAKLTSKQKEGLLVKYFDALENNEENIGKKKKCMDLNSNGKLATKYVEYDSAKCEITNINI